MAPSKTGPLLSRTPALLYAWYPGSGGGNALARILLGDANPSGKLPGTFPKQLADSPAHALNAYPGTNGTVTYAEGLLVGYRWFDARKEEMLFPFGYEVSDTKFVSFGTETHARQKRKNPGRTIEFEVANTGDGEVAQAV